jgi:hypothetical protein
MDKAVRVLSFFAAFLTSALAWAYDVAVMPVKGVNLQAGQSDAIGMIVAQEYQKASGYQVAGPDVTRPLLKEGTDYMGTARQLGAGEYIETVAVMLDQKMAISMERHDTNTGKVVYSANMQALTMDDVPDVAQRLSRALLLQTSPEQTRTIENVTKVEGEQRNQVSSVTAKGVKGALIFPFVKGVDVNPMASLAFDIRIEKLDYFLNFTVGIALPGEMESTYRSYGYGFADFGAGYFFTRGVLGPYLGGGFSPRIQIAKASGIGFAPFAFLGAEFPRDSKARGILEFRAAYNALPIAKKETPDYSFSSSGMTSVVVADDLGGKHPAELSVQFGIVW